MALTESQKKKIEEEEKYRQAVVASISEKKTKSTQKHGVPLLLSIFVPGLGQLTKGEVKKGLLIFFLPIIGFILVALFSLIISGVEVLNTLLQVWLFGIVLYIWQLIDAYNN